MVGTARDGTEEVIELPELDSGVLVAGIAYDATLNMVRHFAVRVTDRSVLQGNLVPVAMGKVLARLQDDGAKAVVKRQMEAELGETDGHSAE
jgi:hypothetical protein